jgi:hypothetical protein
LDGDGQRGNGLRGREREYGLRARPEQRDLSQVRGSYAVVMAQSGGVMTTCLVDSAELAVVTTQQLPAGATTMTMDGNSSGGLDSWSGATLGGDADGPLIVTGHMDIAGEGPLTVVDGQAPARATALTVVRSDGTAVEATVENGEFFAWWPGSAEAATAKVTTASGAADERFVVPPTALGNAAPTSPTESDGTVPAGNSGA